MPSQDQAVKERLGVAHEAAAETAGGAKEGGAAGGKEEAAETAQARAGQKVGRVAWPPL